MVPFWLILLIGAALFVGWFAYVREAVTSASLRRTLYWSGAAALVLCLGGAFLVFLVPPGTPMFWVLGALILVVGFSLPWSFGRVTLLRVGGVALPVAMAGYGAYQVIVSEIGDGQSDWRINSAVIAGGVVAMGWLFTFAVQQLRDEQTRHTTRNEIMLALAAEILDALRDRVKDDLSRDIAEISAGIRKGDRHLFIPAPKEPRVFEGLVAQLPILPKAPLNAVVAYYTQVYDLRNYARDLQSDRFFRSLQSADGREYAANAFYHYGSMRKKTDDLGVNALHLLNDAMPYSSRVTVPSRETDANLGGSA